MARPCVARAWVWRFGFALLGRMPIRSNGRRRTLDWLSALERKPRTESRELRPLCGRHGGDGINDDSHREIEVRVFWQTGREALAERVVGVEG